MKNNMNASAVAVAAAPENNLASANTIPPIAHTTPPIPARDIQVPSSLDMMALAYCIAEEKDMDMKVVHDLLVTAADILQKGDAADIWERVKQLTRGGDADESTNTAKNRTATRKRSTTLPTGTSDLSNPASTSSASFDDAEETEEEAYELGYQNGLQDGESGFGRIQRKWPGRGKERNGLASAYSAGYELGYSTGRDSVNHRRRDKRTDAESYYNGYDVEESLYDDYDR